MSLAITHIGLTRGLLRQITCLTVALLKRSSTIEITGQQENKGSGT